jgi:serine phosphatase RsbU (regulator of sigma subunit)
MSGWRFPFKYKLSLCIAVIIFGLLGGAFLLIQNLIERNVAAEIERDLASARQLVSRLIEERRLHLGELAQGLAGDSLTRTLLTDKTLDGPTRDDIVEDEILPNFPQLKLLAVMDVNGDARGLSDSAKLLGPRLSEHPAVRGSLQGRPALGFMRHEGLFLQLSAIPLRIGPLNAREVIGAVVVGAPWLKQDLQTIRELSQADIAFFEDRGIFLSSGFPFETEDGKGSATPAAWEDLTSLSATHSATVQVGPERFIMIKIVEPPTVSPSYVVARSLDRQLEFLNQVRLWLVRLGIGGILLGFAVSYALALGISRPIRALQAALRRVELVDFSQAVSVKSRDEFGELAVSFNRMQDGLIEREKMRRALLMAEEVQRNLLPAGPPQVRHLDVAGASIYCEAIGGDYYDFLDGPDGTGGALRVAVGDVCGHGTAAALLMATVRALLRSRSLQAGAIERVVFDVNRELTRDVKDSGRFMTLFVLEIDPGARQLRWVRAGHEPAIVYHPDQDRFEELSGPGLAIGVDADHVYQPQDKNVMDGEVVVLATDGVWEARSPSGAMYGKARVFDLIRRHAAMPAEGILQAVFSDLKGFQQAGGFEDDATLVVVKVDLAG